MKKAIKQMLKRIIVAREYVNEFTSVRMLAVIPIAYTAWRRLGDYICN